MCLSGKQSYTNAELARKRNAVNFILMILSDSSKNFLSSKKNNWECWECKMRVINKTQTKKPAEYYQQQQQQSNGSTGKTHTVDPPATVDSDSATMHNSKRFCGTFASVDKHRRTVFIDSVSFACN